MAASTLTRPEGADYPDVVIGVDTHKEFHVAVAVAPNGGRLGECSIPANRQGYGVLQDWALEQGSRPVFAVEDTGYFGSGLCRELLAVGYSVVDQPAGSFYPQPSGQGRCFRRRGCSPLQCYRVRPYIETVSIFSSVRRLRWHRVELSGKMHPSQCSTYLFLLHIKMYSKSERNQNRWTTKRSLTQYLLLSLATLAITIIAGSRYILYRAPWVDELMLFLNYPLNSPLDAFQPLGLYDQAAPSLYSLLFSWTAWLDTPQIRLFHFSILCLFAILSLGFDRRSLLAIVIATVAISGLPYPYKFLFEMKHYGLEAIGTLGIFLWFIKKQETTTMGFADLLLLIFLSFMGISTSVSAGIAVLVFMAKKILYKQRLDRADYINTLCFFAFFTWNYGLIKHITKYQISNYPTAYLDAGPLGNIRGYGHSLIELFGAPGKPLIGIIVILMIVITLLTNPFQEGRKREATQLFQLSVVIFTIFFLMSLVGIYPMKFARHAIWAAPIAWISIYYCISNTIESIIPSYNESQNIHRRVRCKSAIILLGQSKYILLPALIATAFFLGMSIANHARLILLTPSRDTLDATNYIRKHDKSIMLTSGGQVVLEYYKRQYSDLDRRRVIGTLNPKSSYAFSDNPLEAPRIPVNSSKPGAWARYLQPNSETDATFLASLKAIRRDGTFLIFSYWPGALTQTQENFISDLDCSIADKEEFGVAKVYTIACPGKV